MSKSNRGYYNHTFCLTSDNIKKFKEIFIKKKVSKTNKYWFSRQKRFYFKIDELKSQISIFNETNLGEELKKNNLFLINLFFLITIRKFINLFTTYNKFNSSINNSINNLDFYLNKIKILFLNEKKLKKKLLQINEKFPSKIKFFLYLYKNLSSLEKRNSYKHMLEIGGGPAINACLLNYKYKTKSIIIDLQIQNIIAFLFISNFFPNIKISFESWDNLIKKYGNIKNTFKHYDIIFLSPVDLGKLPNNLCDLSINLCAFQEMNKTTIKSYITETKRILNKKNLFISINRESKFLGVKSFYNYKHLHINPLILLKKSKFVFPKYNFSTRHMISVFKFK